MSAHSVRRQIIARVLLVLLAAPALTFVLDQALPSIASGSWLFMSRLLALAVGSLLLCHPASSPGDEENEGSIRAQSHFIRYDFLLILGVAPFPLLSNQFEAAGITLLAATIEEVIFRKQVPAVVTPLLTRLGFDSYARLSAILISQVVFAVTHFVVTGHQDPLGAGDPLLRLVAAGCFLAIIYELSGLITTVFIHFALNEWIRTGHFGSFSAPTTSLLALYVGIAVVGVVWAQRYRSRRRFAEVL